MTNNDDRSVDMAIAHAQAIYEFKESGLAVQRELMKRVRNQGDIEKAFAVWEKAKNTLASINSEMKAQQSN